MDEFAMGKDHVHQKLLNWIPLKSVPEWLNKLTSTVLWATGNIPRSFSKGKQTFVYEFTFLVCFSPHTYFEVENLCVIIIIKFLCEHMSVQTPHDTSKANSADTHKNNTEYV